MRKVWGGVFSGESSAIADRFGQSIGTDLIFWQEDIVASIAHARMLGETGVISKEDAKTLIEGLQKIHDDGPEQLPSDVEDIHTAVEMKLKEIVGDVAGKLHSARSRNDQVGTDVRLYLQNELLALGEATKRFQTILLVNAEANAKTLMPGYTHGQRAQPITLGFYLMAHFWAMQRHGVRLQSIAEIANYSPLGSAAGFGTNFPIDSFATSEELGFTAPMPNALDATSDRSSILDALHGLALIMIDLSRLSQDLILFSSREYGFLQLSDSLTTGSSIMPQKRNPDMAELIRGRANQAISNWVQLASTMKGLGMGYNRDTQDDKPPLFESFRLTFDSLDLAGAMIQSAHWNKDRMRESLHGDYSTATDLANALVSSGLPFREAHEAVGKLVKDCTSRKIALEDLSIADIEKLMPGISKEALLVLQPEHSVASRESYGGPGPKAFQAQLTLAKEMLAQPDFPNWA